MSQIERIQIFGARASGTNWIDSLAGQNYPKVDVLRTDFDGGADNFGWKHGDIGSRKRMYVDDRSVRDNGHGYLVWEEQGINVAINDERHVGVDKDGDIYIQNGIVPLDEESLSHALLIVVYRNPIAWLQSLQRLPHHALELYGASLSDLLTKPWRTYHSPPRMEEASPSERQKWIDKGELIEDEPSVFAHRETSIMITESFKERVPNVVYLNYEVVRRDPERAIRKIAEVYGIQTTALFVREDSHKGHKAGNVTFKEAPYPSVREEDLIVIFDRLSHEAEQAAGYELLPQPSSFSEEQLVRPAALVTIRSTTRYYRDGELLKVGG